MDDIAALKWVQKNIAAFGGDPGNVTLFGQSYGAGTQHFLAMSPLSKGLFGKMITQSHARYPKDPVLFEVATGYSTLKKAEASGDAFVARLGVHSLAELRALPLDKVMQGNVGDGHLVDGYVLAAQLCSGRPMPWAPSTERSGHGRLQQGRRPGPRPETHL